MKYELTKELETGHTLIDSEHRQLFDKVNKLQDACSRGEGRAQIASYAGFLTDYVKQHFKDEEMLQKQTNYAEYMTHRQFHLGYTQKLDAAASDLKKADAGIASLAKLNELIGILISHIRIEDKKMALHVRTVEGK